MAVGHPRPQMTEYDAAVLWMKARGFNFDRHTKLWINPKWPGGIYDANIIQCLRDAIGEQRLPTRADIIDMLRQVTNVAKTCCGGKSATTTQLKLVNRARQMVDSFKLPAR